MGLHVRLVMHRGVCPALPAPTTPSQQAVAPPHAMLDTISTFNALFLVHFRPPTVLVAQHVVQLAAILASQTMLSATVSAAHVMQGMTLTRAALLFAPQPLRTAPGVRAAMRPPVFPVAATMP